MIAVVDELRTSQARVRALEAKLAEAVQLLRYAGEIMDEYQSLWKEAQLILTAYRSSCCLRGGPLRAGAMPKNVRAWGCRPAWGASR